MTRYKAIIAYDGTKYCGFQRQLNGNTVQAELEATLKKLTNNQEVIVYASGRTDAGVHAWGQVIHFDYPQQVVAEKLRHALDTQTPSDISVREIIQVADDFHARYDATEKTYHYYLDIGKTRNPFKRHYAAYYAYPLNLSKMQGAIATVVGTHDFSAFCATGTAVTDKVRTIHEARIEVSGEDELLFVFRGDGFLYKMVRILVGTLLKIGNERLAIGEMEEIIVSGNREMAGPTAHAEGLYLMSVKYLA